MKGYSELEVLDPAHVTLWKLVTAVVGRFPERDRGEQLLRCHEVARAVQTAFHEGTVVDGHYGSAEHSWIELEKRGRVVAILDTYTVAALPLVQLVLADPLVGPFNLYRPGKPRRDIRHEVIADLLAGR